jgi:CRP-like cAMP-binding protein
MACFLNVPHQATVTSVGESAVEVYEFSDIELIAKDNPDLVLQMMRILVERLQDLKPRKPKTLH